MVDQPTSALLTDLFGPDRIVRLAPENIPAGITDALTSTFLTQVGLPKSVANHFITIADLNQGLIPLPQAEPFAEWNWQVPPGFQGHFYLGEISSGQMGHIALDGESGAVYFISESGAPPAILNSNVGWLCYFMYALRRDKYLYSQDYFDQKNPDLDAEDMVDTYEIAAAKIRSDFIAADPAALSTPENPWDSGLAELGTGMWG